MWIFCAVMLHYIIIAITGYREPDQYIFDTRFVMEFGQLWGRFFSTVALRPVKAVY